MHILLSTPEQQRDFLMDVLRRISASDPKHTQFAPLVLAAAREAVEFVDEENERQRSA